MYISELAFGEFIEIEILQEDMDSENGEEIKINTKVDTIDGNVLKAVIPDNLRRLRDISEIFVYYRTDEKCKRWICKLEGFERSNKLSIIILSCDSKSEDVNNREAYRVSYGDDIEYEFNETKTGGHLKDISATGLGLYTNKNHEIGDKISLILEDLGYKLNLEGHVVRRENQRLGIYKYLYGIKMNNKTEIEREEVMSYIFKKQLEIIRERKRPD